MKLIEEPVEIEKGRGELVEDESGAVEIDKGSLSHIVRVSQSN